MAFHSLNLSSHMVRFNSTTTCDLLDMYDHIVDEEIIAKNEKPKHKTFAPSQMRCDRVSWFRLRGTQPDKVKTPDRGLTFTADIGTACHEIIQKRLSSYLGEDWIPVPEWVSMNPTLFESYDMDIDSKGYESMISLKHPYPVRFACDGIIRLNGKVYLLEIKTAEFSSLQNLTSPKSKHIDQIKCYATLLHIPNVIFFYIDRQYGDTKCFELTVTDHDQFQLKSRMDDILELVEANIAPEGLPVGDPDCTPNMCPYYKVCREWGRK